MLSNLSNSSEKCHLKFFFLLSKVLDNDDLPLTFSIIHPRCIKVGLE